MWLQAIGVELQLRYDVGREPMPEPITDALSRMSDPKKGPSDGPEPALDGGKVERGETPAISGEADLNSHSHEKAA